MVDDNKCHFTLSDADLVSNIDRKCESGFTLTKTVTDGVTEKAYTDTVKLALEFLEYVETKTYKIEDDFITDKFIADLAKEFVLKDLTFKTEELKKKAEEAAKDKI